MDNKIKNNWGEIEKGDILYVRQNFTYDYPNRIFKNWEIKKAVVVHVETWKEKYSPYYTNIIILFRNPFSLFDDNYKHVEHLSLSLMKLNDGGKYETYKKIIYAGRNEDHIDKYEIDLTPEIFNKDILGIKNNYERQLRDINDIIKNLDKCLIS